MTSIVELSHDISSTGSGTTVPSSAFAASAKLPPAPRANPVGRPPKSATQASEKKSEEDQQLQRKMELSVKIEQYLKSPKLRFYFQDNPIKPPPEHASLEAFQACYDLIKKVIAMESKRILVDSLFETVISSGSDFSDQFLGTNTSGFADFCLHPDVKDQMFQPELEEISIEISDWMVPDPKIRLLFKILRAYQDFKKIKEISESRDKYDQSVNPENSEKQEREDSPDRSSSSSSSYGNRANNSRRGRR